MDWYQTFILVILFLWLVSTPRDRDALRVVLIASLFSEVIVDFITHNIHGAWKLAIPGAVEVLTIVSLLTWAKGPTGFAQAYLLLIAWLAHVLCYLDVAMKTDLVYSRYETIIQLVAVAQIIAFHDTLASCGRGLVALFGSVRPSRYVGLHLAGVRHRVLPAGAAAVVSEDGGTQEVRRVS